MIKTMAVRITDKNYSVAVACAPKLVDIPFGILVGEMLVINMPSVRYDENGGSSLSFRNDWMPGSVFAEEYEIAGNDDDRSFVDFTEVVWIKRSEEIDTEPEELDPVLQEYYGRRVRYGRVRRNTYRQAREF